MGQLSTPSPAPDLWVASTNNAEPWLRATRVQKTTLGLGVRFNAAAIASVSSLSKFNVTA